jgi:hypothetical protein
MNPPTKARTRKPSAHEYTVHGSVTDARGEAIHKAEVVVGWQRMRDLVVLAKGRTTERGHYELKYRLPEHATPPVLIIVEARSKRLKDALRSPLNPVQPDLQIDLAAAPRDESEFATLAGMLQPQIEPLALTDVGETAEHADISFLSQEIGKTPEQIMRVVLAARLEAAYSIPAAAWYAFLRQRVPPTLPNPLLEASQQFTLIDALVRRIASLIFASSAELQQRTLTTAIARDLIGSQFASLIESIVGKLQSLRSTDALEQPYLIGKATLGELLGLATLPKDKQRAFAEALTQQTRSMREFWRTLGDGKHGFSGAEASAIERTLSLGAFVKNHAPLVKILLQRFDSGTYESLADLARLKPDEWTELVREAGPPPSIDPAGAAEPAEVFAKVIYTRVTRAFSTVALASQLESGRIVKKDEQAPLGRFFRNNADLNLLRHNLGTYVSESGEAAFAGIAAKDQPQVIVNARKMQRVLRITTNVDAAQSLLSMDLHSATQVAMLGRQQFFVEATKAGIAKRDANRIYSTSVQRYAGLVSLYTQFNRDAIGIWPRSIGKIADIDQPMADAIQRDQSLVTLFGAQDFCTTESCTSILSPAAYLCDLLYWLKHRITAGQSAFDVLNGRRGDIANLKLNCPNSETPLPYIDLVNEILADAIAPPANPNSTINPPWKQTSAQATAAQLRASPEYFNQEAYDALFGANYPHMLPYSDGLNKLRACLQQSGIALWQLRQALRPLRNPTIAQQVAVAAERFGLGPRNVDLIVTAGLVTANIAWNLPAAANPLADLAPVRALMQAGSLTYEQLLELLSVAWVQGALNVQLQGVDDTCDTTKQALSPAPLDGAWLDRAHRFLRLWHATSYKMWELDLLLGSAAVANGTLDNNGLIALFTFRALQDATRLAVDQQLAFFQNLDVASHRDPDGSATISLYARVFLNPAVISQHPDADLAAIPVAGPLNDSTLSNHLDAIQAALAISAADGQALATLFGMTVPNSLTLANLSLLYRVTHLATAARLSIPELQTVGLLINPGAANITAAITAAFATPAASLAFLTQAQSISGSGFSIDALAYLLAPPPWSSPAGITDAGVATVLEAVRQAIVTPSGGDVNGSVTAALAGRLGLADDVTAFLVQQLQVPGTGQTALAVLTDPALVAQVGGVFTDLTRVNFPDAFVAVQLLDKARLVALAMHLVSTDLAWLFTNAGAYGGLDFTQLPVTNAQPKLALAPLLATALLVKLARAFKAAPPQSAIQTLYDVIGGASDGSLVNEPAVQAAVATVTGWTIADITAFAAALGIVFPADYTNPATYEALRTLEAMITAMARKAQGSHLVNWGQVPPDESSAEAMAASALNVLKARYSSNDWLSVAPSMMNPLREDRSAALQAYLIADRDGAGNLLYGDVNGLFDHFLIDVQMSSCEVSTRVVQAYIAVQIFVERCRMNLESPAVQIDPLDEAWEWWTWMKRYRIWEAARQVFLYPENWMIESQRVNRTEIFQKLEQEVHQNEHTADAFEKVVLNYVDRLDEIAHLQVTGTCQDPVTHAIHVIARSNAEPPRFYHRVLSEGAWSGWEQIPLDIKAHQVVPALYRGRLCLFWAEVHVASEPHQNLPAAQESSTAPSQEVSKFVTLGLYFSIFRNDAWSPAQAAKGKLFDVPLMSSQFASDSRSVEALYTLKIQVLQPTPGYGATLAVDLFRLGDYTIIDFPLGYFFSDIFIPLDTNPNSAVHIGRGVFDGRFSELELRNLDVYINGADVHLLQHAQFAYGSEALPLVPLSAADPDLVSEPGLVPQAGALATLPANPAGGSNQTLPLNFTPTGLQQGAGPLLNTASVPFRVVGPNNDLSFDPASYFFYQDNRRCYFVASQKYYWTGSAWSPVPPSNPDAAPFQARYAFQRFYHPYTRLIWHQLAGGGFPAIYDRNLQLNPDQVDPSHADVFSFQNTYQPLVPRVSWGEDNEIFDFDPGAAYSVYNWELFFHTPFYVAQLLTQNQQFEDALIWFHYIFDPTRHGGEPAPQRFWIPKPLYNLTSADILKARINNLLQLVNQGDPDAVGQVTRWRNDPFNPFLLADLRPVAYMKAVVMAYLDTLIAWADKLFATASREALSEATLLYTIAAEILGPQPQAITPPPHADDSYNELAPKLDAFANAMVDIENLLGAGGGGGTGGDPLPAPQTFYFRIPPNGTLLQYWKTVADRLFKLRHCQNLRGITRSLGLFDAPIDPGLLIRARAAGVDIGSVLSDLQAALPNYRFTALYSQALDFVNAVRAYGALLLSALEKSDAAQLAVLLATNQQELLSDGDQISAWQVEQAENAISVLNQALVLDAQRLQYYNDAKDDYINAWEKTGITLQSAALLVNLIYTIDQSIAAGASLLPLLTVGVSGFGATPVGTLKERFAAAIKEGATAVKSIADTLDKGGMLANNIGKLMHNKEDWNEKIAETNIDVTKTNLQLAGAELALQVAQQNQINHQTQMDQLQRQIDFLTAKFSNEELYDWMVGELSDTYFQSYQLAYKLCKQLERCYQFELGETDSAFIQFGYWDSMRKGLLAGEALNHDLRRMQASYLEKNARRFEISRFVSLAALDANALAQLLLTGGCDFDLPESFWDHDYSGHYNRHLVRASVTVVYPTPGKFDNVKATLTLVNNRVRVNADLAGGYAEAPPGNDPRFVYSYAAVPQKIVLGNGQDDPGLFLTAISNNLGDQRYLPFEGAGAISSWHFEMPAANNEIQLARVTDLVLHLYYTALDGGDALKQGVLNG